MLPEGYEFDDGVINQRENRVLRLCRYKGNRYAIKIFIQCLDQYFHEVFMLKQLARHDNVIQFINDFELDQDRKAIVLEYCPQDLKAHLQNHNISQEQRLNYFGQIVSAFKFIQEDLKQIDYQFQHRDIKPENIMIGENGQIKLIDFGESRIVDLKQDKDQYLYSPSTQLWGTPGYMDPMMQYLNEGFQEKSDLWSLGATLFYLLTNKVLLIEKRVMNSQISKVPRQKRKEWKIQFLQNQIDQQIVTCIENEQSKLLLKKLLSVDAKDRYDWQQLFSDSFVSNLLIPQKNICLKARKRIIRLQETSALQCFSSETRDGKEEKFDFAEIIKNGLSHFQTSNRMIQLFDEIKFSCNDFLLHWQNFEKLNYLMHLRSLTIFHGYNRIFSEGKEKHGKFRVEKTNLEKLKESEIYERVQLQIYYLFDCVKKSIEGNGLEAKIKQLSRLPLQEEENREYSELLEFNSDEKFYFSFTKLDKKLSNPDNFDDEKFHELYLSYSLKCIHLFIKNHHILSNVEEVYVLSKLIGCYKLEKKGGIFFYQKPIGKKKSKTWIFIEIFNTLKNIPELNVGRNIFNIYFYFEVEYSQASDKRIVMHIYNLITRKFPRNFCILVEISEAKIDIILSVKCQQNCLQLWSGYDGVINIKYLKQQITQLISSQGD